MSRLLIANIRLLICLKQGKLQAGAILIISDSTLYPSSIY